MKAGVRDVGTGAAEWQRTEEHPTRQQWKTGVDCHLKTAAEGWRLRRQPAPGSHWEHARHSATAPAYQRATAQRPARHSAHNVVPIKRPSKQAPHLATVFAPSWCQGQLGRRLRRRSAGARPPSCSRLQEGPGSASLGGQRQQQSGHNLQSCCEAPNAAHW